jgi:preprotein translocase subunit SecE
MARQTRAQRRARRQQQAAQPALAGNGGGQAKPPVRLAPQPPDRPERQPRERGGFGRFVGESIGELKKVEWPSQNQVIQGTVVVLIACVIVGTYLWLADLAFRRLVQDVFLR